MNIANNPSRGRPFPCALVLEPAQSSRSGIAKLLKGKGASVIACPIPSQILSLARQHRPDVAILDLDVPGIDAEQSVAMLEALTTLILVAPRDIDVTHLTSLEASGALQVMVKRVSSEGMLHAFHQAIAESRRRSIRRRAAA